LAAWRENEDYKSEPESSDTSGKCVYSRNISHIARKKTKTAAP
jgi:hypothetical protein